MNRPLDSPSELLEPIERGQLKEHIDPEDDVLRFFRIPLSGKEEMIEEVSQHQNGEIQGWELRGHRKKGGGNEIDKMISFRPYQGTSRGIRT